MDIKCDEIENIVNTHGSLKNILSTTPQGFTYTGALFLCEESIEQQF